MKKSFADKIGNCNGIMWVMPDHFKKDHNKKYPIFSGYLRVQKKMYQVGIWPSQNDSFSIKLTDHEKYIVDDDENNHNLGLDRVK